MTRSRFLLPAVALLAVLPARSSAADPFEFKDGDRVVLIGSTLIEREQEYGYWESVLTRMNKGKAVTFRNLGWSGDTVHAEARGRFDYANEKKRLGELVLLTKELKPTVIVVCYGHNESFEGKAGVEKFTKGLENLVGELKPTGARIVLMSPTPFFPLAAPPGVTLPVEELKACVDAMKAVAEKTGVEYHDLYGRYVGWRSKQTADFDKYHSDNGIHLTRSGYGITAMFREAEPKFTFQPVTAANADIANRVERLREAIVAKNRLFFHRWRPQNETYLFGFRKHEQGKNAAEVAAFDPLVADAEKTIQELLKDVDALKASGER